MKLEKTLLFLMTMLCCYLGNAQEKFTISGYIEDAENGEKLIGASIFDNKSLKGAVSNIYGFYSLTLPKDSVYLNFSYVGYAPQARSFLLDKDMSINIKLGTELELETVEVVSERFERIEEESQMSRVEVPIEQIEKVPALLGEPDVLKALQLLPGVQSGGEGQNGLYVRGGSPDQNLVLLDGVPVYNVSHILGFFSVFNSDAIKNVTLTKGGFPARFGGRLSSVLEINMKEGNNQEFHGEGSIGLVASRLTLEGPIIKDKMSFMVSGRRTYVDFLAKPLVSSAAANEDLDVKLKLFFYDLNAKINYKINDKHRLYLSSYSGSDVFGIDSKETEPDGDSFRLIGDTRWGNIITAFRWNYLISNKLFSNTTLTFSKFKFDLRSGYEEEFDNTNTFFSAQYFSGITDFAGRIDFDYIPNPDHYIRFGGSITNHTYDPGAFQYEASFDETNLDTLIGSVKARSLEYGLYVEDDFSFGPVKTNLGVHASAFQVYQPEKTFYYSVQPRFGSRVLLPRNYALKASFSTMAQYINLLTNESLSLPTDLWVPSTERVKPQTSWQVGLGAARTFADDYEVSIEGYYKRMNNVISYREGADFLGFQSDWQDKVTQGNGEAYGLEFFVQKKRGKTNGWIGYTLSWNNRQFDDINGGEVFPFKYDRRHDVSLVVSHQFNDRISLTGSWVYGTGNAISLPLYRYSSPIVYDENFGFQHYRDIETIGEKNSFRMKAYHRFDISVEFFKKKKRHERKWAVGFYNLYNRKNPYFIYSATSFENNERVRKFKQFSLFPIIPSVAYSFKF